MEPYNFYSIALGIATNGYHDVLVLPYTAICWIIFLLLCNLHVVIKLMSDVACQCW